MSCSEFHSDKNGCGCNTTLCFIIPPHILKHMAQNAQDPQLQQAATRALAVRSAIHQERQAASARAQQQKAALAAEAPRPDNKNRVIFDAQNSVNLQMSPPKRQEGDGDTDDLAVDEAYNYSGLTWDFFKQVFGRNSIDDAGLDLISTVHYRRNFENAFWNGEQMVYGDGFPTVSNRFTICIDVIGHELTHGVTQYTANLRYQGQSGALNEHVSDVFGSLIKQMSLNHTADQADWLIGEGLWVPKEGVNRTALRSMSAPGTAYDDPAVLGRDPQPDHMDRYLNLPEDEDNDYGGVHINSGIPNKAFYLAATALGGYAWEKAGRIWYRTLTGGQLRSRATFAEMAALTVAAAEELFDSDVAQTVSDAWAGVGVTGAMV
jgi:Zn-dependent metalloprotease